MRARRLLLLAVVASAAAAVGAQPPATRTVSGVVVRSDSAGDRPVVGEWVTLHRVAEDSAAPLDSVRTDARGAYAFRYRPFGSQDAIYFVAARYGGIAYFAPPLTAAAVSGDDARITVFDTSSAPAPTVVRGRHVIVGSLDSTGSRSVIEVYEISNDSDVTFVAPTGAAAERTGTFWAALPKGATGFRAGQGDVPPDGLLVRGDRVVVDVPFAPGIKQLSFSYVLAEDDFPLRIVVDRPTSVLELLVEDPAASAAGARLTSVGPVSLDGRDFKRYLAQDVAGRDTVLVSVAKVSGANRRFVPVLMVALGLALLGGLVLALRRRGAARPAVADVGAPSHGDRERLAREITELDAAFAAEREASTDARDEYERRRARLKGELAAALARDPGGR